MNRITQGGFFSGAGTIPLASAMRHPTVHQHLSQQQIQSPEIVEARRALDKAVKHYQSVEDNLSMLDETMGPEAALQALEEGSASIKRAREELERLGGVISG